MTSTLVITGVDGFVGRHLARLGHEAGLRVIGVSRSAVPGPALIRWLSEYHSADLRDGWPITLPEGAAVVHLAGLAAVGPSFDDPQAYLSGNSAMVTWMCEALLEQGRLDTRVVGVSTGAVYANKDADAERSEGDAVAFSSPYVVSKVLVENQLAYYRQRGLDVVVARPFNHIGPGQGPGFLVPDLLERLRGLSEGEPLRVGNLATRRDYTDVRDVARSYLALATAPSLPHLRYNVASGKARSGSEMLALLCASLERPLPQLEVDPSRVRVSDPESIVGDASLLTEDTGWAPRIPLEQTIADLVAGSGE